jgi:hypothetical protein
MIKKANLRQLFLRTILFLIIGNVLAQKSEIHNDYLNFYENSLKQGLIKTQKDSLLVSLAYKKYVELYDSARTYALKAIPNIDEDECILDYYLKSIYFLKECFSYDSLLTTKKAKQDTLFNGIRNEYEFQVIFYDLSFDNPRDVRSFIVNKTYRTSAPGSTYYPIKTLTLYDNNTWEKTYHKNAKEMTDYWVFGEGEQPELEIETENGFWELDDHVLILLNQSKKEIKRIKLTEPGSIEGLHYPDPNDMSGESEVRHFWKCGKCGCKPGKWSGK